MFNTRDTSFYLVITGDKDLSIDGWTNIIVNGLLSPTKNDEWLFPKIDRVLKKKVQEQVPISIVIGGNQGADKIGLSYAVSRRFDYKKFEPLWQQEGKQAGYRAIERMMLYASCRNDKGCLVFWDGKDTYTKNEILQAYVVSIPTRVYMYTERRWLTQEEIEKLQEDEYRSHMRYL